MTIPRRAGWVRWLIIVWGVLIFIWLGQEDNHVWPVALLGAGAAMIFALAWVQGRYGGRSISPVGVPLWGASFGAGVGLGGAVMTAFLMLFKNVRHAHIMPDYPNALMGAMLALSPAWMLAGMCFGVGAGIILIVWQGK